VGTLERLQEALVRLQRDAEVSRSDDARAELSELAGRFRAERRLVVYGSLQPGEKNEHELAHLRGEWRRGAITGTLVPSGWGASLGYPALRWSPDGPRVDASLLESDDLPADWGRLDAFEGEGYRRILVPFHFEGPAGDDWRLGQVYAEA